MELPPDESFAEYQNKMTVLELRKKIKSGMDLSGNTSPSIYILDQDMATLHFSLLFTRGKPWNKVFSKYVDLLVSSGIVAHLEAEFDQTVKHDDNQEPQTLTMNQLGVCFLLIVGFWGFSCIVFVGECIFGYLTK